MTGFLNDPSLMGDMQQGMNYLSAGTSYMAAQQKNAYAKQWQAYSNAMVNIQNGQNQNAISNNEQIAVTQSVNTDANIQKAGLIMGAKQQVMSAAAGVQGRSVNQSLMAIQAQASTARDNNQINLNNQLNDYANERDQSNMKAAMEQNYSYLPTPQISNYLLPAAMQNMKIDSNQPVDANNAMNAQQGMQSSYDTGQVY